MRQKQERLHEELLKRETERRYGPTSLVYNEQARRLPNQHGVYNKTGGELLSTKEAFHKNKNLEIDLIKQASKAAKHVGPGVTDKCQETFKLLRSGDTEAQQQEAKQTLAYNSLESQMHEKMKLKDEFHQQVKQHGLDEEKKKIQMKKL